MDRKLANHQNVWILEDEDECRFVYEKILSIRYEITFFDTVEEFSSQISKVENDEIKPPELVIADLLLKDGNFINYLTEAKSEAILGIPFIIVSSIDDIDALRFCFTEGALDYLTKPFKKNEILVKIENILSGKNRPIIDAGPRTLTLDGQKIENLTSKQIQMLSLFLSAPARMINRSDILTKVWGDTTVHPKTVDVHLYNLRRKLHPYGYLIRSEGGGKWSLLSDRVHY
ncbi:MAG: response regulator transcription factor [Halobacteriovoraceae bacterium]|nr:response regulator transcription factor [Halobacteriovoraceae bacterium]